MQTIESYKDEELMTDIRLVYGTLFRGYLIEKQKTNGSCLIKH